MICQPAVDRDRQYFVECREQFERVVNSSSVPFGPDC